MAQHSPERMAALNRLRDECLAIGDTISATTAWEQWTEMRAVALSAWEAQDLGGLRSLKSDLAEMVRELPAEPRRALEAAIQARLGPDLGSERLVELALIAEIRSRGRIRNDREYRLVQGRVEEMSLDPEGADDVSALNGLLSTYRATAV